MTLQELMAGAQDPRARYGAPVGVGGSPFMQQLGINPAVAAQIDAATQPEATVDEPVPGKSKLWAKILSAIADAGSAYGSALAGGPRTDFSGRMAENDRSIPKIMAANEARRKDAMSKSKAKREELKLKALLDERNRSEALQARSEDLAWRKTQETQAQQRHDAERQADSEAKIKAVEVEMAWKERMVSADQRHDEAMARIRGQQESGSKSASDQLKGLSEAKAGVNKIANNLPKLMQGYTDEAGEHPPMKPDQVMTMFRRSVAELNLDKDALAAAQAYFDKEVASQFQSLAGGGASGSW